MMTVPIGTIAIEEKKDRCIPPRYRFPEGTHLHLNSVLLGVRAKDYSFGAHGHSGSSGGQPLKFMVVQEQLGRKHSKDRKSEISCNAVTCIAIGKFPIEWKQI